jgi:hypothetical protein
MEQRDLKHFSLAAGLAMAICVFTYTGTVPRHLGVNQIQGLSKTWDYHLKISKKSYIYFFDRFFHQDFPGFKIHRRVKFNDC